MPIKTLKLLPAPKKRKNLVPKVRQHAAKEIEKLVADTAAMRFWGYTYEQIAQQLKVSRRQVKRYYDQFIEENKKDWLEHKGSVLTEINVGFKRVMAFAERKREKSVLRETKYIKENDEEGRSRAEEKAGAWNKQILDAMNRYVNFLKDCGFITQETVDGFAITADAKKTDIVGALVDTYQDYLKEVIESESKQNGNAKIVAPRT